MTALESRSGPPSRLCWEVLPFRRRLPRCRILPARFDYRGDHGSVVCRNCGSQPPNGGMDKFHRQTLASEDAETRRRHGRVNILRLGPVDDYTNAYKKQWLDPHNEELRLRRRNVETPSAPPPPE